MHEEFSAADGRRAHMTAWLSTMDSTHRARGVPPGWKYSSIEHLMLTCGYWTLPTPLPMGRAFGPERQCYANASAYSEIHDVAYTEGYALSTSGVVYAHAWCVDQHGQVHDPTWRHGGVAYLGLSFSKSYVHDCNQRSGAACLVHDPHLDDYRLLREGLPADAIVSIGEPVTKTSTTRH
ncbi:hypothetical protein AOZ06_04660 [Kibdelosporangium phytohabitans]|uniref:Uncharacterized protein n=1 Tax=Kibdelosporangium phytohabitans TaxID=860235 RepID=A0A0N9HPC1_9PSEU|nr:hypothetical protein AOZ06_04660 [Kibdelosporangium phytohabitans]